MARSGPCSRKGDLMWFSAPLLREETRDEIGVAASVDKQGDGTARAGSLYLSSITVLYYSSIVLTPAMIH